MEELRTQRDGLRPATDGIICCWTTERLSLRCWLYAGEFCSQRCWLGSEGLTDYELVLVLVKHCAGYPRSQQWNGDGLVMVRVVSVTAAVGKFPRGDGVMTAAGADGKGGV